MENGKINLKEIKPKVSFKPSNINKQYIVSAAGNVIERQNNTYIVEAKNKEEAELIAKNRFNSEYYVINDSIDVNTKKRTGTAIMACILMSISILISLNPKWTFNMYDTLCIKPDMTSLLYAMFLYVGFVLRFKGIQETVQSKIDIIMVLLIITLLSTFVQILIAPREVFFLEKVDPQALLIFAIIMSWVGFKLASIISFAGIMILSLVYINQVSDALGIFGVIYILCAFLGMLMYLSIEPALYDITNNLKNTFNKSASYAKRDIIEAKSEAQFIGGKTKSLIDEYKAKKRIEDK